MKKTEAVFPDYTNSILNLSCSILNHFGVKPKHPTLPVADELLSGSYKHVVLVLLDGLGVNILEKHLRAGDFFRQKFVCPYSSVFPPTTTASTTSVLSGRSPVEHGWLGWDVYFKQEDKTVTCFTNNLMGTEIPAASYHVAHKYLPFTNIAEQINSVCGENTASIVFPFGEGGFPKFSDWLSEIKRQCSLPQRTFTYAYWEQPDGVLHISGTNADCVHRTMIELNNAIEKLCKSLSDTAVFITADHGHTDIKRNFFCEQYPDFARMLVRPPSIEPRGISFYVKDEYLKPADNDCGDTVFAVEFERLFGRDYVLFTQKQVFEMQLFGPGTPNENLTGIGDYIAAATGKRTLFWDKTAKPFKSHHAGMSRDEMEIPLIFFGEK